MTLAMIGTNTQKATLTEQTKGEKDYMNIKFFIPTGCVVPTDLRLKVDDVHVHYSRITNGFIFEIYEPDAMKAKAIVDEVIKQIISDNDESQHGVSWRTTSFAELESHWDGSHIYEWHYRVRDSY